MKWSQLRQDIQYMAMYNSAPKVLFIHVGSNDIGSVKCSVLRQSFKSDILAIHELFPSTILCISAMLPRRDWSRSSIPADKIEKKRKLLNRFLRRQALHFGGRFVAHEEIKSDTKGFYYEDDIHMSDVGNDLFIMALRDTLEQLFL